METINHLYEVHPIEKDILLVCQRLTGHETKEESRLEELVKSQVNGRCARNIPTNNDT